MNLKLLNDETNADCGLAITPFNTRKLKTTIIRVKINAY